MRKLYMFNFVTLDGYFEGARKWEIDWHNVDDEFHEFAIKQLNATDLLMFGRVTYEGMAAYWATPEAMKSDPIVAEKMNSLPKIVFSKTLREASWNNTRLIRDNAAKEVAQLKRQAGKEIALLGSANLASSLIREGLIDEFRIMINPVVLGKGGPLFGNIKTKINLRLERMRSFKSGNVLLYYTQAGQVVKS